MKSTEPRVSDPAGTMYVRDDGICFKIGRHGHTYRHNGDEWVKSECRLERIFGGRYALSVPRVVPRAVSEFAMPPPQVTNR